MQIIHLRDFAFWKIFRGLEPNEIEERQSKLDYPPRLQIECVQIDPCKSLHFQFGISKTHDLGVVIANFVVNKKATGM